MTDEKFGIWRFRPPILQRLARIQYFCVFLAIFGFVIGILPMYSVSQITSLEKHFGLTSQQAGTIVASSEIGFIATSLITGHFLSPLHRPRIIGICALLTSLSCYIYTIPYLLHSGQNNGASTGSASINKDTVNLCGVRPQCQKLDNETDSSAYYLFIICTILSGIGSTSFYTLGISYVDDNSSKKVSPKYIGYILSLRFVAPGMGLLLGAATSTVPVHLDKTGAVSDLNYVGAWWMGYYVIGTLALVAGLPILMFPKRLKQITAIMEDHIELNNGETVEVKSNEDLNNEEEKLSAEVEIKGQEKQENANTESGLEITKALLKDFPKAMYRLVSKPAFDLLALSMTVDICGMVGFVAFAPKYVESQFDQSPAQANFIIGLAIPAATSFGIIVSGKIMSQSEKNLRQKILASVITMLLAYGSFPILLSFQCPQTEIQPYETQSKCNQHCSCLDRDFSTICGSDGKTYFSPCHAGCTDYNTEMFTQCTCVPGNRTAVMGHCSVTCNYGQIIGYATVQFVINFVSTVATMPVIMLSLRVVRPSDKSLSLALINVVASIFIFPTPILFGTLVDNACILRFPENDCSASSGACAYYNKDNFRLALHLLGTGLKIASPLFLLGSWFATRNMNLDPDPDNPPRREKRNESTGNNGSTD